MKHPRASGTCRWSAVSTMARVSHRLFFLPSPGRSIALTDPHERGRLVYNSLPLSHGEKKSRRGPRPYRLSIGTAAPSALGPVTRYRRGISVLKPTLANLVYILSTYLISILPRTRDAQRKRASHPTLHSPCVLPLQIGEWYNGHSGTRDKFL